jgi:hypothetical protein
MGKRCLPYYMGERCSPYYTWADHKGRHYRGEKEAFNSVWLPMLDGSFG